jgi:hypothetical protein
MTQSLDIIKHILDENLIDAKRETENYLNNILSSSLENQYKEVAPTMFTNNVNTEEPSAE